MFTDKKYIKELLHVTTLALNPENADRTLFAHAGNTIYVKKSGLSVTTEETKKGVISYDLYSVMCELGKLSEDTKSAAVDEDDNCYCTFGATYA